MPPELPNEQELNLKKRARRRLVGAIALVMLMVIVLPQVLQDRVAMAPQGAITITMPDVENKQIIQMDEGASEAAFQPDENEGAQQSSAEVDEVIKPEGNAKVVIPKKAINTADNRVENKSELKATETKPQATTTQNKKEHFAVQIGVYSDAGNVKRLQNQLKQSGFNTYTEKVTTAKGEGVRLKVGNFTSRQEAERVIVKLKSLDLSGIVVSYE